MMGKEIGSPHNALFRNILGREDVARDFVRYYLPQEIVGDLELDTLEVGAESYVSDDLRESFSDIVLSLQLRNGGPAEIYILVEHKSGLNKWTKLQLFKYLDAKWHELDRDGKLGDSLPIIIPVVFYHGKKKWRYSLEFSDQFNLPGENYRKYIPKFEHILHEVPKINKQKVKSTIVLEVFHVILEYIFYPDKREYIYQSLELLFQCLSADKAGELFYVFIKYILSATNVSARELEDRVKHLPKGEETVRTTAEILRKEGYDVGYDKGYGRGVSLGEEYGKLQSAQEMLIDILSEQYGILPSLLEEKIRSIKSVTRLKNLARQAVKLDGIEDIEKAVNIAAGN